MSLVKVLWTALRSTFHADTTFRRQRSIHLLVSFMGTRSATWCLPAAGHAEREATAKVLRQYGIDQAFRVATPPGK
jgi:hypothetical protein